MNRTLLSHAASLALVVNAVAFGTACGGGNDNLPPPPPAPPMPPTALVSAPVATEPVKTAEPKPLPPPPAVSLALGEASADPTGALPTSKFMAPTNEQVIPQDKASEFIIKIDVKNWQTAVGSSHVHLILDNKPYKALFNLKDVVKLGELAGTEPLAEGHHILVAFPSRANHESVKTKGALAAVEFYVGKKKAGETSTKKPMLVFSRPKGEYKGDNANHVLVDFQLQNAALAEGKEHVTLQVTGPGIDKELTAKATKFGPPFFLDHLQDGSYNLKLELKDKDGKVLPGAWNSTSRTITINRSAATDNPHAGHTMPVGMSATAAPTATAPAPTTTAPAAPKR
jgi:hypothetical protein